MTVLSEMIKLLPGIRENKDKTVNYGSYTLRFVKYNFCCDYILYDNKTFIAEIKTNINGGNMVLSLYKLSKPSYEKLCLTFNIKQFEYDMEDSVHVSDLPSYMYPAKLNYRPIIPPDRRKIPTSSFIYINGKSHVKISRKHPNAKRSLCYLPELHNTVLTAEIVAIFKFKDLILYDLAKYLTDSVMIIIFIHIENKNTIWEDGNGCFTDDSNELVDSGSFEVSYDFSDLNNIKTTHHVGSWKKWVGNYYINRYEYQNRNKRSTQPSEVDALSKNKN